MLTSTQSAIIRAITFGRGTTDTALASAATPTAPEAPPLPPDAPSDRSEAPAESEHRGIVLDHTNFDVTRHDGRLTIFNPATGNHRTFRIHSQPKDADFAPGRRVVSLLIGPDNSTFGDWRGFAFADDFGVHVWRRWEGTEYAAYGKMLENPRRFGERGCQYMMEAVCRRCGRALTNPESVASGVGPVCAGK